VPAGDHGGDKVGTITRLTIAADFSEALKQVLRGLDALRSPVCRPARIIQPALVGQGAGLGQGREAKENGQEQQKSFRE